MQTDKKPHKNGKLIGYKYCVLCIAAFRLTELLYPRAVKRYAIYNKNYIAKNNRRTNLFIYLRPEGI